MDNHISFLPGFMYSLFILHGTPSTHQPPTSHPPSIFQLWTRSLCCILLFCPLVKRTSIFSCCFYSSYCWVGWMDLGLDCSAAILTLLLMFFPPAVFVVGFPSLFHCSRDRISFDFQFSTQLLKENSGECRKKKQRSRSRSRRKSRVSSSFRF